MAYYRWDGDGDFQDNLHNRVIAPGDVVELEDTVIRGHDFTEVDEPPGEGGAETDDTASGDDTPLAEKDYSELRQMAVEADTDAINGRSPKDEIIAYFSDS